MYSSYGLVNFIDDILLITNEHKFTHEFCNYVKSSGENSENEEKKHILYIAICACNIVAKWMP